MVQRQNLISIATTTALCLTIGGAAVFAIKSSGTPETKPQVALANPKSQVLPLVGHSAKERVLQLSAITKLPQSIDRDRARYLLAGDLIAQQQGEKALLLLENLEKSYPVLAAPIALRRAQAANNSTQWQELLKNHADSPLSTEALFALGKTDKQYWERAIAKYPNHPRSLEIARNLLRENPNRSDLMLLVVKNSIPADMAIADRLVKLGAKLTPADWEAISTAYWTTKNYGKAALAYNKAPRTALNLYRQGRSLQVSAKRPQAIATYQQLIGYFPTAKESGLALTQLAAMAKNERAIAYYDRVIAGFPTQAGAALAAKAEILDSQNKKAATQVRNVMLRKYGDSEAAAEYRWKIALEKAEAQNYQQAWQWAQTIPTRNPKSILAPRAGFWVGKWAEKLGKKPESKAAYEYVLSQFPQSYYAWRSAVNLGLNVGNFTTVRQVNPQVIPPERVSLPAGSATLKELYQLGQDKDALALWQVEFTNKTQPTVAEQFTDGVMSLAKGDNLLGINKIATLEDRETPPERAEYQALSQKLTYWQARYPFPFLQEIKYWSSQRQINPLLVTALIRQESRFEPKIRSVAGAIGLMQVMPATGDWIAEKIKLEQYNAQLPKDNILLGTWFLNYTHEQYNNNSLFAIASYNAGPNAVSKWRDRFDISDPDEFVEAIPYEETKGYVRQVFGNYWNYLRLYNREVSKLVASYSTTHPKTTSLP
ncbi:MAG: transglycosylase SLT domain-containing protein [Chroococcus sp. CMT-3BRIN-NPC107]|jgi:soluble lytic murein transglycosylase|nr:transglycosylase SLT domain-containing protein [Chroococcus sp. CMT-3BRIN-NPC107]